MQNFSTLGVEIKKLFASQKRDWFADGQGRVTSWIKDDMHSNEASFTPFNRSETVHKLVKMVFAIKSQIRCLE